MFEKGKYKYFQPINDVSKFGDLSPKTVKNVVMLDPNRYTRKPYIIRSHSR